MSAIKKGHSDTSEQINSRIQRKFDQVFSEVKKQSAEINETQNLSMVMDSSADFGDIDMSSSSSKKEAADSPVIDLDFAIEDEIGSDLPELSQAKKPVSGAEIGAQ